MDVLQQAAEDISKATGNQVSGGVILVLVFASPSPLQLFGTRNSPGHYALLGLTPVTRTVGRVS